MHFFQFELAFTHLPIPQYRDSRNTRNRLKLPFNCIKKDHLLTDK